jgi:hypothetical protein
MISAIIIHLPGFMKLVWMNMDFCIICIMFLMEIDIKLVHVPRMRNVSCDTNQGGEFTGLGEIWDGTVGLVIAVGTAAYDIYDIAN